MAGVNIKNLEGEIKRLLGQGGVDAVPQVVDTILTTALNAGATDVHLECFRDNIQIKFRLDGMLHSIARLSKDFQENIIARLKIMSRVASFLTREPQDGRIEFTNEQGETIVMRSSFLPTLYGEKVVVRIPDPTHLAYEIDTLGMSPKIQQKLTSMLYQLQGTILLTGPSSSGKTTTIYAILKYLNRQFAGKINIMTVEDPIEANLDGANQTQVDIAGGLDYARALKAMLRQDPNVLVVGEIRDAETAHICIEAGLTGHLVISTIHSGEAVGVIMRLLNMGIEPFLVASSVTGVIAQRLVRKLCPSCSRERPATDQEKLILGISPEETFMINEERGCAECNFTGYKGRTGIFELLTITPKLQELIIARATTESLRQQAIADGMFTLSQDATAKVRAGITTPEEILHLFFTHT
ncbi:MAG: GspE/PulE family protein [Candidatus Sumerlaeia bacterium]|nr:GspE/PulE family protein [Candidatus Sumerlaeia bacterium]